MRGGNTSRATRGTRSTTAAAPTNQPSTCSLPSAATEAHRRRQLERQGWSIDKRNNALTRTRTNDRMTLPSSLCTQIRASSVRHVVRDHRSRLQQQRRAYAGRIRTGEEHRRQVAYEWLMHAAVGSGLVAHTVAPDPSTTCARASLVIGCCALNL